MKSFSILAVQKLEREEKMGYFQRNTTSPRNRLPKGGAI